MKRRPGRLAGGPVSLVIPGSVLALVLCAWLLPLAGCNSDCPVVDECTGAIDGRAPDSPGKADAGVSDRSGAQCNLGKVKCKAGQIDAFGFCLDLTGMVKVPAGEFVMGHDEKGQPHNPKHRVSLSEYLIDKTEVPMAHYKACVDCGKCTSPLRDGSNTGREPYYGNPTYNNYPVIYVSWHQATAYCKAIGKRLPTEAEWEKAARGTTGQTYPWGSNNPSLTLANYQGTKNDTAQVNQYGAGKSPFGLFNMAGNVWEWVNDTYSADYYSSSPKDNPKGPPEGSVKVARGGGFTSYSAHLKTWYRAAHAADAAYSVLGFRCAKDRW